MLGEIEMLGARRGLPAHVQADLHRQWWEGYGALVVKGCEDAAIWVVGKTAFNCLSKLPAWKCNGWIYQPNASGVDLNRNWPALLDKCWTYRRQ